MASQRTLHTLAAILAALLVVGATTPALASPGSDALTLGTDITLNTPENRQTYADKGVVSANLTHPDMAVTIAEEREDVGLDWTLNPLKGTARNDFIRITYREEIQRTIRIPVHADYWTPFPRDELESMDGDTMATLKPMKDGGQTYTLITVQFSGPGSVVFPIPEDAVAVYSAASRTENRTNTTFGVDLGLTPTPWSTIPTSVFGNETTVRLEGNPDTMMIQYNAGTSTEPVWLKVPDSQTRTSPYYTMEKTGVEGAVYVVSTTEDPPELRYKEQANLADRISESVREARHLPARIARGLGFRLPDFNILTGVPHGGY